MNRKEYLENQKQEHGRRLMGVFPAQHPREILWALDIVPAEIWDPPLEEDTASGHLQPYICGVAKLGLELILKGKANLADAFLFPHTCDSIQNLASVVEDYLGVGKPCYFFYHPKQPYWQAAKNFYLAELKKLAQNLAGQFGTLDEQKLASRVEQGGRLNSLLNELYELRLAGRLAPGNRLFYEQTRRVEWMWPDDLIPELERFKQDQAGEDRRPALILSGVLPNPAGMLDLLDDLGLRVAGDDFLNGGRRLQPSAGDPAQPWQALRERYFAMPPCSSKNSTIADRADYLKKQVAQAKAKGVVFLMVKFCEPELFDVPALAAELKNEGIPSLTVDLELNQGLGGGLATRLEAFAEMIA